MNTIHPTAIIGPEVSLGTGNTIGPFTVLEGRVVLGDDNWIGPHVVIGAPGEIRGGDHRTSWADQASESPVVIGSRNVIREFTAVHRGSVRDTLIGDDCYVMNKVYVAHDAIICSGATLSAGVLLAGHVIVGPGANLGLGTCVHQRMVIGAGAMLGMGSVVTRHIPPHAVAFGSPARVQRANEVGLRRRGVDDQLIEALDRALKDSDHDAVRRLVPGDAAVHAAALEANATPGSKLPEDMLVGPR